MKIVRSFVLAAASSVLVAGAASAYEFGDDRDRTLVVNAHALDHRQQVVQRPVQGATVTVYTRRLSSTVPIFLKEAVTDASGRARLLYRAGVPGTFRVLATGPRAEVRRGRVRGEQGGLLDLTLNAVTSVDTPNTGFAEIETGELIDLRPFYPVPIEAVRYEKALRLTGDAGTTFMILDQGDRGLAWCHRELAAASHVSALRRVTYAFPVEGLQGGDVRATTQGQAAIAPRGPIQSEVVLLALGQVVVRRVLHRQLLTEEATIQDVYAGGRRPTVRAVTATALGLVALLATHMGDALVARDGALLRSQVQGTSYVVSEGGDRHVGCGLEAPAGLFQARAEYAALGQRSVQNVFCGLWDLTDEADGDTDGVVAGASDQVDGRRLGGVGRLVEDLHDASLELAEGTATLSLQEAWTRRLRARYGAAGAQALRLNGVDVR